MESTNKIIKDRLNKSLCLTDVIEKIQRIFNQQSKKAILTKCKNKISTREILLIMEKYFLELNKFYNSYQQEIVKENNYNQLQSLFSSLIKNIPHINHIYIPVFDLSIEELNELFSSAPEDKWDKKEIVRNEHFSSTPEGINTSARLLENELFSSALGSK
ncbi:hypothetical protein C1645_837102 [Glomus cerebriforme]|uniref:Uncharacterized protein n=1 Tax=Glomus cerebriforme TaxID=658196 RepID=A0A397SG17_9GLOM|nr:hypothetical protein C1645_837102 [Glomus cerebriforme]